MTKTKFRNNKITSDSSCAWMSCVCVFSILMSLNIIICDIEKKHTHTSMNSNDGWARTLLSATNRSICRHITSHTWKHIHIHMYTARTPTNRKYVNVEMTARRDRERGIEMKKLSDPDWHVRIYRTIFMGMPMPQRLLLRHFPFRPWTKEKRFVFVCFQTCLCLAYINQYSFFFLTRNGYILVNISHVLLSWLQWQHKETHFAYQDTCQSFVT